MKKEFVLLFFIILLIEGNLLEAQNRFKGGFTLAINGSQIDGDSMSGYNKGGLLAGVFVEYPLALRTNISFELLYSMKGSREKDTEDPNYIPIGPWHMLRLSYLEIPVKIEYKLTEKILAGGGIGCGILVGKKMIGIDRIEDTRYDAIRPYDIFPLFILKYRALDKIDFMLRYSYSILSVKKGRSNFFLARTNKGMHNNVISGGLNWYIGGK